MGLFSKKKVIYDSTSSLLMEGESGDLFKSSILASVIMDTPIASDLVANMVDSYGSRANNFYNYAKQNMEGAVPKSVHKRDYVDFEYVKFYLTNEYLPTKTGVDPQPIEIESMAVETADPYLFTVRYLGEQGIVLDRSNDKLPTAPRESTNNTTANSLFYKEAEFTDAGKLSLTLSIGAPGATAIVAGDPEEVILLTVDTYKNVDDDKKVSAEMYLYVAYRLLDTDVKTPIGDPQYFYYRINSHTIKEISDSITVETGSDYFPTIPFIAKGKKQTWIEANRDSTDPATQKLWRDRRNLCRRLRLDYVNIGESLLGEADIPFTDDGTGANKKTAKNDSLPDVESAFISLSIPIAVEGDENMAAVKYLFRYFDNLHTRKPDSKRYFDRILAESKGSAFKSLLSGYGVEISDDHGYRVKLQWNYIDKTEVTGVIGDVGYHKKELDAGSYEDFGSGIFAGMYSTSKVILKRQITKTTYEQIVISGLLHSLFIGNKELETDIKKAIKNRDKGDGFNFNIPLEVDTFNSFLVIERTDIMYQAVRFSVNSRTVIKLKWYQREFMGPLLIVAAIAISIINAPAGASLWSIAGGVAIDMAIGYAIGLAVQLLVDKLGMDSGLAALLVVAVAIKTGMDTGYIPADELLHTVSAAASMASMANSKAMELEMEELAAQGKELEKAYKELEEQKDSLTNDWLSTDIVRLLNGRDRVAPIETTDEFFYRKLRVNPGTLAISSTETYFNNALQLPDINGLNALAF